MTPAQRGAFGGVERAENWLAFVYTCRSSRGIQAATRRGAVFAELGEDGVKMLEMILGVDGLVVCFQ